MLKSEIEKLSATAILCDDNSYKFCYNYLELPSEFPLIIIKSGEKHKSLKILNFIYQKFSEYNLQRNSVLILLGGGVITDIGGFVASTFKRGIDFVNIPTTLTGMTDAALGGKNGVNFNNLKNYIGTFSLPKKIILYPQFLQTLEQKHIKSGFAEMLKHGLIADKSYFYELNNFKLSRNNIEINKHFEDLIHKSVNIKNSIANADLKEDNIRKILNFGHTIGHALESFYIKSKILHGYCVAAGMLCESYISFRKGILNEQNFGKIEHVILKFFKPIKIEENQISKIAALTLKDKKNINSNINCILLEDIGKAIFNKQVTLPEIEESLRYYQNLCR